MNNITKKPMEAKEIRLKNLLYYNNDIKEVCSIHSDNTIRFKDNENSSIGCFFLNNTLIKPIPLTEDILLKCGFEKKDNNYYLGNFRFHIYNPCNYYGFLFCDGHRVITDKIHFLHQFASNHELELY